MDNSLSLTLEGKFKFGVKYPIVISALPVVYGIQLNPQSGRIYLSPGKPSNVLLEFLPANDNDRYDGRVRESREVGWKFYHPDNDQYYILGQYIPGRTTGNYLVGRPYKPGEHVPTFPVQYRSKDNHPIPVQREAERDLKAIQEIEEAVERAAFAREALKKKEGEQKSLRLQQEAAEALHQLRVLKLNNICFPHWENEKALRHRLASAVTGGEVTKVQSEVGAMEKTMIACIEIFLSYGTGIIKHDRVKKLLDESKVPKDIIDVMNNHHSAFGLPSRYDSQNRLDIPPQKIGWGDLINPIAGGPIAGKVKGQLSMQALEKPESTYDMEESPPIP